MNKERIVYILFFALMLMTGLAIAATVNIKGNYDVSVDESLTADKVVDDKYVNNLLTSQLESDNRNDAARAFSNEIQRCGTADNLIRLNACTAAMKTVNDGFE